MSKELEAFAKVKERLEIWDCSEESNWEEYSTGSYQCEKELEIIEKGLKESEQIKAVLQDFHLANPQNLIDYLKNCKELEKEYSRLVGEKTFLVNKVADEQKKLKALEIIKDKRLDVAWLIKWLKSDDYDRYHHVMLYHREDLTQEEYDLLKEVLL